MADRKISDLTALTTPATGDLIPIVDVSEAAAADKNKSITVGELLRGAPDGTAAAPGIAFESDGGNGIFLAGTDQVGVATGGVERVEFGASEVVFNDGGADYDFRIEGDTNTALFFVDASADAVGVGTTSPGVKFEVNCGTDNVAAEFVSTDARVNIGFADNGTTLYSGFSGVRVGADGDNLALYTGNSESARIDSAGRVGIGTSSPFDTLHVGGTGDTGIRLGTQGSTGRARIYVDSGNDFGLRVDTQNVSNALFIDRPTGNVGVGTTSPLASGGFRGVTASGSTGGIFWFAKAGAQKGYIYGQDNDVTIASTDASGVIRLLTGGNTERARIDSSGRLLVGTSSTSANCRAIVQSESSDTSGSGIFLLSRGNNSPASAQALGQLWFTDSGHGQAASIEGSRDGGTWTSGSSQPSKLTFSTTANGASSPTERMRITSGGQVYIGAPGGIGTVGSTDGISFDPVGNFGVCATSNRSILARRSTNGSVLEFRRDTTGVGSISVTTTATSYNTSSDYRLKENVVNLDGAITRVKQLAPKRFNFIADADTTVDGFLAHEAQTVVPEAVTGTHNEVDDDGNAVMQGIDQSKLVPLLTAALQEAIGEIESLKARVAALEAN